jgi:hypothetical protein
MTTNGFVSEPVAWQIVCLPWLMLLPWVALPEPWLSAPASLFAPAWLFVAA